MRKIALWMLVALSVLGIGLAADLTQKHFQLKYDKQASFDSLCEVSETLSCAKVNESKYSSISMGEGRPGLPVAVPAIGFFAMIALLALVAIFSEERSRKALALAWVATVPALLFGLWLVYVQAALIGAWCLFCLALDSATLGVFVLTFVLHGGKLDGLLADLRSTDRGLLSFSLVLFAVLTLASYGSFKSKVEQAGGVDTRKLADGGGTTPHAGAAHGGEQGGDHAGHNHGPGEDHARSLDEMSPEERQKAIEESRTALVEFLDAYSKLPVMEVRVRDFDGQKGNPDAKVTLVEFADFECPHCKQTAFFLQDIAQRYYDLVHFVFKNYALGKDCNPNLKRDLHPDSCEAAVAVQCARQQDRFWPFHDQTFDNQGSLGTRKMLKIADNLGLDRTAFEDCLGRESSWEQVRTQIRDGSAVEVTGTPSLFVNGRSLPTIHPLAIEAALRKALKDAGVTELPDDPDGFFPH